MCTFKPFAQVTILGNRPQPAIGKRQTMHERGIVQRMGRCNRNGTRHVRDAVMHDAVDDIGRVGMGRGMGGLEAAALVDRNVDDNGTLFMPDSISRVTSFGLPRRGSGPHR